MAMEKYGLLREDANSMKPDHLVAEGLEADGSTYRGSLFDSMVEEEIEAARENTQGQSWPRIGILVKNDGSIEHELLHRLLRLERGGKSPDIRDFQNCLDNLDDLEGIEDPQVIFSKGFSEKYGMDYEKCWVVRAETEKAYEKLTEAAETGHWNIIRPFYTEDVEFDSLTRELRSEKFDEYLTRYLTPGDEFFEGDFEYYDLDRSGYLVEEALRRMEAASEDLEKFVRNFANLDNVGVRSEDELVEYGMSLPPVKELENLEGSFMADTYQRKLSDYGVLPEEFKNLDSGSS